MNALTAVRGKVQRARGLMRMGHFRETWSVFYSKGEELVSPRIHTRTDADGGTRVNERGDPSLMRSVNLNKRLLLLLELEQ